MTLDNKNKSSTKKSEQRKLYKPIVRFEKERRNNSFWGQFSPSRAFKKDERGWKSIAQRSKKWKNTILH